MLEKYSRCFQACSVFTEAPCETSWHHDNFYPPPPPSWDLCTGIGRELLSSNVCLSRHSRVERKKIIVSSLHSSVSFLMPCDINYGETRRQKTASLDDTTFHDDPWSSPEVGWLPRCLASSTATDLLPACLSCYIPMSHPPHLLWYSITHTPGDRGPPSITGEGCAGSIKQGIFGSKSTPNNESVSLDSTPGSGALQSQSLYCHVSFKSFFFLCQVSVHPSYLLAQSLQNPYLLGFVIECFDNSPFKLTMPVALRSVGHSTHWKHRDFLMRHQSSFGLHCLSGTRFCWALVHCTILFQGTAILL